MSEIGIGPATAEDWQAFLLWATAEGWRVPSNEIAFHQRPGVQTAFALRKGECICGFATAVHHQTSGWIGNLLIAPAMRGQGLGTKLFETAVALLLRRGAQTLWLTASEQGAQLYRSRGFQEVGRITRWVRNMGGMGLASCRTGDLAQGKHADLAVWQESRSELLTHLSSQGDWLITSQSAALLQRCPEYEILGPWVDRIKRNEALPLLDRAIATATPGKALVMDLLCSDDGSAAVLDAHCFQCCGETRLMVLGPLGDVHLERLYSLASLGSVG